MAGLKFRILVDSVTESEIFREILINENSTFEELYLAIIKSFGLENDQMASFYVSNENWDKGEEITLMDMSFDDSEEPLLEMDTVQMKEKIFESNQKFILVYDFLKMWIFLIELCSTVEVEVNQPEVLISVGEIQKEKKEKGPHAMEDFQFDIKNEENFDWENEDLDDFDDFDNMDFDNIDDFDI